MIYYLLSKSIVIDRPVLFDSCFLDVAKDAERYGRFWGVERSYKKVYVHKVNLDMSDRELLKPFEHLGFYIKRLRSINLSLRPLSQKDNNYPKILRVQKRHIADYVERKMLFAETDKDSSP